MNIFVFWTIIVTLVIAAYAINSLFLIFLMIFIATCYFDQVN